MTLQQFITEYNGKSGIGDTKDNRGECVGLWEVWTDNLGEPHTWGNADDLMANAPRDAFEVVYNTVTNYPSPGDGLCMQAGWYGSPVGHVAIVVNATPNTVTVFEQNDRVGGGDGSCRLYTFDYTGVQGWLHPKVLDNQQQSNNQGNEDMTDVGDIAALYVKLVGRQPYDWANDKWIDPDAAAWVGKDWHDAFYGIKDSDEGRAYSAQVEAAIQSAPAMQGLQKQVTDLTAQAQAQQGVIDGLNARLLAQPTQWTAITPPPATVETPPQSEVSPKDDKASQVSVNPPNGIAKYNKFLVAGAGAVITTATVLLGANNPIVVGIITVATALGVFTIPNKV